MLQTCDFWNGVQGKPQEIKRCDKCQDHHAGRPALRLEWPGERKSIGATSRSKCRFSKSPGAPRAKKSIGEQGKVTVTGAWGLGLDLKAPSPGVGARARSLATSFSSF